MLKREGKQARGTLLFVHLATDRHVRVLLVRQQRAASPSVPDRTARDSLPAHSLVHLKHAELLPCFDIRRDFLRGVKKKHTTRLCACQDIQRAL